VGREEYNDENNIGTKLLLNKLNCSLKAEITTIAGMDYINGKIRLRVWKETEDNAKEMYGDKMDMNDNIKPEKGQRITVLHKIENNKQQESEGEQHIFSNKLKEGLHITYRTVRPLQCLNGKGCGK
jgi:hypothetical protein